MNRDFNRILDGLAFVGVGGSLMHWLPPIAAGLSVLWIGMQMWSWLVNKKWKRDVR